MKLFLISDLHSQSAALDYLKQILSQKNGDGIVCCGDITNYGRAEYLDDLFDLIKSSGLPAFLVWGNADLKDAREKILLSPYNSHLQKRFFGDTAIYGISETDEPISIQPKDVAGTILITHKPPLLTLLNLKHKNAPDCHISGHLHDKKWVKHYPSTTHIQVPSLQFGEYGIFDLETRAVSFKKSI